PNTQGIGARVKLVGSSLTQSQEMICGGRYLSSDQDMRVFAADAGGGKVIRLEVQWRNGGHSSITNVQPNRIYEIDEAGAESKSEIRNPKSEIATPLFQDVSDWLGHVHFEAPFDDWARQPLLPRRLSRLGPGVSWYDVNGDGWEDLIVTAGRRGKLTVFMND